MRLFSALLALLVLPAALGASPPLAPGIYELSIQVPDGLICEKLFVHKDEKHQLSIGVFQPCGIGFRAEIPAEAKGFAVDIPDGLVILPRGQPAFSILAFRGTPKKTSGQEQLTGFQGHVTVLVATGTAEYPFTLSQLDDRPGATSSSP